MFYVPSGVMFQPIINLKKKHPTLSYEIVDNRNSIVVRIKNKKRGRIPKLILTDWDDTETLISERIELIEKKINNKKPKKQTRTKRQSLEATLDKEYWELIKTIRCYESTGNPNQWYCATCNWLYERPYKQWEIWLQRGHNYSRTFKNIKYDLVNTSIQCSKCNQKHHLKGMYAERKQYIIKKFWQDEMDRLDKAVIEYNSWQARSLTTGEMIELLDRVRWYMLLLKESINKNRLFKE